MTKKMTASVEELIDAVREYPVIYDRINTVSGAQQNEEKNIAWLKISERLDDDPSVLKAKWRNLRDSYQKAAKNRKELEEIGHLHRYHEYKHEEKMSFLYEHVIADLNMTVQRKRKTSSSYPPNIKSLKTEMYKMDSPYDTIEYVLERVDDSPDEVEEEDIESEEVNLEKEIEDEESLMKCVENPKSYCYDLSDDQQIEDNEETYQEKPIIVENPPQSSELDVWLESIKDSMSKLTKLNQARAKRDINAILSNYEIEQLESNL